MSTILSKVQEFFGMEPDEELLEEEITQPAPEPVEKTNFTPRKGKVVNIHTTTQLKVVVLTPESFDEAREIADNLKAKRPVVINLEGLEKDIAGSWTSLILILTSVILTALNIFPSLAKFAGAGVLVPITGFANGVAASAIEFKKEGQVFGIGCRIFQIAGPVILYGIFTSWVLGLLYWILKLMGAV